MTPSGAPDHDLADLIVVGDLLADVVVEAGTLVREGDVYGTVRIRPAGSAANAAVWAAGHGAHVRLFGRVGDDLPGRLLREALTDRGVDATLTVSGAEPTGAMLVVREAGERSMVADRGANRSVSPTDLPDVLNARAVLVSGYLFFHPDSEPAAAAALERAAADLIAVEASSWPLLEGYGPDRFLSATKHATMLLANEREAQTLSGAEGDRMLEELGRSYDVVVVKLGARGAVATAGGDSFASAAPEIVEADPTGAGDAFNGVLLAELARGVDLPAALREACRAGATAAASLETWPDR
jgi:sugar/nucleoside kinase (ribokinase family)